MSFTKPEEVIANFERIYSDQTKCRQVILFATKTKFEIRRTEAFREKIQQVQSTIKERLMGRDQVCFMFQFGRKRIQHVCMTKICFYMKLSQVIISNFINSIK
jgi:hypothetical protein